MLNRQHTELLHAHSCKKDCSFVSISISNSCLSTRSISWPNVTATQTATPNAKKTLIGRPILAHRHEQVQLAGQLREREEQQQHLLPKAYVYIYNMCLARKHSVPTHLGGEAKVEDHPGSIGALPGTQEGRKSSKLWLSR